MYQLYTATATTTTTTNNNNDDNTTNNTNDNSHNNQDRRFACCRWDRDQAKGKKGRDRGLRRSGENGYSMSQCDYVMLCYDIL